MNQKDDIEKTDEKMYITSILLMNIIMNIYNHK